MRLCGTTIQMTLLLPRLMFGVLAIAPTSAHGADVKVYENIAAGCMHTRPRGFRVYGNRVEAITVLITHCISRHHLLI